MNIPTAENLRTKIVQATAKNLIPVREAADGVLAKFSAHIENLTANPIQYTYHDRYSVEMPGTAYNNEEYFFTHLRLALCPLGYVVEKSHDGGGMYSTVVIRWNIETNSKTRKLSV